MKNIDLTPVIELEAGNGAYENGPNEAAGGNLLGPYHAHIKEITTDNVQNYQCSGYNQKTGCNKLFSIFQNKFHVF